MSNIDVGTALATIIYGLFLTELFACFHKIIRSKNVQWHWLPILSAWFVFLVILKNWWAITGSGSEEQWTNVITFAVYCHLFVLIYLLVASVFPDDVSSEGIDLKEYYFSNSRYFWTLMSLIIIGSLINGIIVGVANGKTIELSKIFSSFIPLLLTVSLAIWRSYLLHAIVLSFLVLAVLQEMISSVT